MEIDLSVWKNKRICIAMSGGSDSTALFMYCTEKAGVYGISLSAVNIDHGIRGKESELDSLFVKDLCSKYDVPLYAYKADIPAMAEEDGEGLEERARKYRYSIFREILEEDKADYVATAHQAADNAESVLLNLFRGSSLAGMGGIRECIPVSVGKAIIRPMLSLEKREILEYLQEKRIDYRTDESNGDIKFTRNYARKKILEPVEERFPRAESKIYSFSKMAREDEEYLSSIAENKLAVNGEEISFSAALPMPVLRRCAVLSMRKLGAEKDITGAHIAAVCGLAGAQGGIQCDLPYGLFAVNDYGNITVGKKKSEIPVFEMPFSAGVFSFPGGTLTVAKGTYEIGKGALTVDKDKLPQDCVLRTRRDGDVFEKFGGGTKRLNDYLTDRKIPQRKRDSIPVLAKGSEIYAVCGIEISEKVRIDETTRTMYRLSYKEGQKEWVEVLFSADEIADRVYDLSRQISTEYADKNPLVVGVLKGGSVFCADIFRSLSVPAQLDFTAVSSYGAGTASSGIIKVKKDLDFNPEGRHVLIVEDIVDSGRTLFLLRNRLLERGAKSVKICALLDKPSRRVVDLSPDYCAFSIDDLFVVGYGLDYAEKYRNLPYVGVLKGIE